MMIELTPQEWLAGMEEKIAPVATLVQLVEPTPGNPDPIMDAKALMHTTFHTFRSGMRDNDPSLHRLARIEHDCAAVLGALNFGDQMWQTA